jgi:hypothetical protein
MRATVYVVSVERPSHCGAIGSSRTKVEVAVHQAVLKMPTLAQSPRQPLRASVCRYLRRLRESADQPFPARTAGSPSSKASGF